MLKNYLKIAFRNLWKHRVFSFLNILGLTVGMTACFLIFLYVKFELSYDRFNTRADRIYRVVTDVITPSETIHTNITSWAQAPNIKNDFPEVEAFVRVQQTDMLIRKGDIKFQEDRTLFADSTLFNVFDFKMIAGNPATALKEPFSVVLNETTAAKFFGDANPLGQSLLLRGDNLAAKVTGVIKDMPSNSQLKADVLVSMSTTTQALNPGQDDQWTNFGVVSYLLLKPNTDPRPLAAKFPAFFEKHIGTSMKDSKMYYTLFLEPLKDVYLKSSRGGFEAGSLDNVYIFSIVGIFILLIACINFVNLTTARSTERAREVGIRKAVGAARQQLIRQFTGEAVILCLIAFVLTLGLTSLLLPSFNTLAGKQISKGVFANAGYVFILLGVAVGSGLLAGIYPALVLSAFKPVMVLKGRFSSGTKGVLLRKGLVVTQFAISIALITGTIVVYRQMNFMRNRELGFSKDQMIVIDTKNEDAREALKQSIAGIPAVKSASLSSSIPGSGNPGAYSEIENKQGDLQVANLDLYFVDYDYIPQFNFKLIAGRAFSKDFATDTTQAMVLNEAAVKLFGYASPQEAIGRRFKQWGREGKIIGVIRDFHFRSLQENIKPLCMRIEPSGCNLLSAHVSAAGLPATIAAVESKWKALMPNRPFSYFFLDEFFDRQYRSEARFGKLFFDFAILAIFISCLGLLGLASYSTRQRTKEIGVRKVVGASMLNIVNLLSRDFIKLVVLSFFIAAPVTWYFMHRWLNDFAYRTTISWWVLALAGILALLIALLTVTFQAIRAALANPVKSLRTE